MKATTKTRIHSISVLAKMQLQSVFSFSIKGHKKESLTKLLFYVVGIAAMTGLLYLVNFLLRYVGVFGMAGAFPMQIWNLVFFAYLLFSFGSILIRLNDALFFAKDNVILMAYPLPAQDVFISKIIVFGLQEVIRNLFFLFPLLLSFGIAHGVAVPYYFWCLLMTVVLSLFGLALSSALSIPFYHSRTLLKRHPIVQSCLLLGLLIGLTVLVFYWLSLVPENLAIAEKWGTHYLPELIRWSHRVCLWLYPLSLLSMMVVGFIPWGSGLSASPNPFNLFSMLAFIGALLIIAGCLVTAYFLSAKSFPSLALRSQEFVKVGSKEQKPKKNTKLPGFLSHLKREVLISIRDYRSVSGYYLLFIITPLAILVLNTLFSAMRKSFAGEILTLFFNGLLMALIALTTSVTVASAHSREGEAGLLTHTFPEDLTLSILSRALLRFVIMTASLIFSVAIYSQHLLVAYLPIIPFFITLYSMYIGHLLWSLEMDFMNPQIALYEKASNKSSINMNEFKSTVFAFLFAFLYAGLLLLFVFENPAFGIYHLLAFSLFFAGARVLLFLLKVKTYGLVRFEGRGGR